MSLYQPEAEFSAEQNRNIRNTVLLVVLIMVILVGGFFYAFTRPKVMSYEQLRENGLFLFESARQLPAFSLVDHRNEPFGIDQLQGRWHLVFFGYTFCPDICPVTMALLQQVYEALPEDRRGDSRIVMASVDPARDTPEKLAGYVGYFHPDFMGVTGEFLELHRFATALSIPFAKVPGAGPNYLVDHSGNVALLDDLGNYRGFFKTPLSAEKIVSTYLSVRSM